MNNQIIVQALSNSALMADMTAEELEEIAGFTEYLRFEDGEQALCEHGESPRPALWLLARGDVDVGVRFSKLENADQMSISKIDAELYGEISWLLDRAPSAGVSCKGKTVFLKIDGAALNGFMESHPEKAAKLMRRIAQVVATRLVNLTNKKRDEALWQF